MRIATCNQEEELGFMHQHQRRWQVKAEMVSDFIFAGDVALMSDQIDQGQELLS